MQFSGTIQPEWKTALENLGATVETYLPDNAFLVRLTPAAARTAAQLNGVRWVGDFQPAYKLSPQLTADTARVRIALASWADTTAVKNELAAQGLEVGGDNGVLITAASAEQLPAIAQLPDVLWIEPFSMPHILNDQATGIMNVPTAWNLGYTGAGQMVTIADTGLDTGVDNHAVNDDIHRDFDNRVMHISSWPVQNYSGVTNVGADDGAADLESGHGTHVAGSVAGNGARSSGTIRGAAYEANITFQAIEQWTTFSNGTSGYSLTGIPSNISQLFLEAYGWGSRIHTNSWGSDDAGAYTTDSQNADDFIWNHKDFTVLFAAGNAGTDADADGYVDEDSLNSPGTAKNVITIGASENVRSSGGLQANYGSLWSSDYPANPTKDDTPSDSAEEMAAFSSRGPTDDGRIKPDLVAPGTNILSTRSISATSTGWGAYNDYYMYDGGTSMATPLAAGAVTVVRDYLVNGAGIANPTAALIKAVLINSADDISGYGNAAEEAGQPIPNNHEGWGRINVAAAVSATNRVLYNDVPLVNGGSHTYLFTVTGTVDALKATLVWSDYPGTPASNGALVNNLNLIVTAPDGSTTYLGNHFSGGWSTTGGSADTVNNVENVYVHNPISGTWTIRVVGANIPQGPQPFALVVSGATAPPPPSLTYVYLPLILKNAGGATTPFGTVTDRGSPVAGMQVIMRYYNGSNWSTYATTTTDSSGNYRFSTVPTLSSSQEYYIRWDNSGGDTRLSYWYCNDITSNSPSSAELQCDFDLQNIDLLSPSPNASVTLPQTFSWQKRTTTSDDYELNILDVTDNNPWWYTYPSLGYNGSYTLNTLPSGFSTHTQYGWLMLVYGSNGYGVSYYYRAIAFNNTGRVIIGAEKPTATLKHLREFIPPAEEK